MLMNTRGSTDRSASAAAVATAGDRAVRRAARAPNG